MIDIKYIQHRLRLLEENVSDMNTVFKSRGCYCDLDINSTMKEHSLSCSHAILMHEMVDNISIIKFELIKESA